MAASDRQIADLMRDLKASSRDRRTRGPSGSPPMPRLPSHSVIRVARCRACPRRLTRRTWQAAAARVGLAAGTLQSRSRGQDSRATCIMRCCPWRCLPAPTPSPDARAKGPRISSQPLPKGSATGCASASPRFTPARRQDAALASSRCFMQAASSPAARAARACSICMSRSEPPAEPAACSAAVGLPSCWAWASAPDMATPGC